MKNGLIALLAGLGIAAGAAIWVEALQKRGVVKMRDTRDERRARRREGLIDLNTASDEQLLALGITRVDFRERIIDNRPYRNKLDLVARMVIPQNIYNRIKNRVCLGGTDEGVKVAL